MALHPSKLCPLPIQSKRRRYFDECIHKSLKKHQKRLFYVLETFARYRSVCFKVEMDDLTLPNPISPLLSKNEQIRRCFFFRWNIQRLTCNSTPYPSQVVLCEEERKQNQSHLQCRFQGRLQNCRGFASWFFVVDDSVETEEDENGWHWTGALRDVGASAAAARAPLTSRKKLFTMIVLRMVQLVIAISLSALALLVLLNTNSHIMTPEVCFRRYDLLQEHC